MVWFKLRKGESVMNEKISENTYTLHNQVEIPCVGFGTWQVPDGETAANAVMHAIEAGYTHIDTAVVYHNEIGVGAGIRMSGAAREKLFVTSKLWNDVRGYDETLKEFGNSLKRLNMDYLDLFLIHWPRPIAFRDNYEEVNRETWRAFEHLLNEGYVRAIGVSNFLPKHLKALLKSAEVVPMIDQIEFHPGWMQPETVSFCEEHGILVEAWSPWALENCCLIRLLWLLPKSITGQLHRSVCAGVFRKGNCHFQNRQHLPASKKICVCLIFRYQRKTPI